MYISDANKCLEGKNEAEWLLRHIQNDYTAAITDSKNGRATPYICIRIKFCKPNGTLIERLLATAITISSNTRIGRTCILMLGLEKEKTKN